ncbi:phage integrase family protein [Mycolicibacterium fortuitum subsp. fortuitum DSM 46621 = ATCC 6841 = JCM 6387]|uniref:Phage integrase family protein n=1 Tax=Mycolicibacterium fortuitum subsp. fortuitum DSM 46621 = ATCC 6841 = JCM 6387 TaxID=1214102 RepID=K0V719_MYCFO|nr:phage integrase family protein [Mycolicibacterium fortuitum subsp. fortuitum DSM 46621 = ATCC 6841 = JCM 6387]BDE00698.1 hypothetical protein MFTT_47910 [Mycolicibacterium fortuitum subsp. fortuitum]CRL58209.1 phage integrase family protein [Mycolicibacterium fortuitum subsp. fortuitum DSM 46621 = ATCC 6841 = JCM 6387]
MLQRRGVKPAPQLHSDASSDMFSGSSGRQVSKWLGHSTSALTLTTYADYINEDDQAAPKVGRGHVRRSQENMLLEYRSAV